MDNNQLTLQVSQLYIIYTKVQYTLKLWFIPNIDDWFCTMCMFYIIWDAFLKAFVIHQLNEGDKDYTLNMFIEELLTRYYDDFERQNSSKTTSLGILVLLIL